VKHYAGEDLVEAFEILRELRDTLKPLEARGLRIVIGIDAAVIAHSPTVAIEAAMLMEDLQKKHNAGIEGVPL
jgi:hypothetical protein